MSFLLRKFEPPTPPPHSPPTSNLPRAPALSLLPPAKQIGPRRNLLHPLPKSALADTPTEQHFLRITYTGDVARISVNGHLLDGNFADGRSWLIGLDRFEAQIAQSGGKLDLSIYPLRKDAPIFFEPGYEPKPDAPLAALQSVELLTQYTLRLKLEPLAAQKK